MFATCTASSAIDLPDPPILPIPIPDPIPVPLCKGSDCTKSVVSRDLSSALTLKASSSYQTRAPLKISSALKERPLFNPRGLDALELGLVRVEAVASRSFRSVPRTATEASSTITYKHRIKQEAFDNIIVKGIKVQETYKL